MGQKDYKRFAARLQQLRHIKRLTQEQLAKKVNVSRSCLANYERGKRYPDRQTLAVMAEYFKVSIEYLTGEISAREHVSAMGSLAEKAKELFHEDWLDISGLSLVQRTSIRDYLEYLVEKENEEVI